MPRGILDPVRIGKTRLLAELAVKASERGSSS
jgi:hypothetical protein